MSNEHRPNSSRTATLFRPNTLKKQPDRTCPPGLELVRMELLTPGRKRNGTVPDKGSTRCDRANSSLPYKDHSRDRLTELRWLVIRATVTCRVQRRATRLVLCPSVWESPRPPLCSTPVPSLANAVPHAMTISPLDTDIFLRGNDLMTTAATTTQYLKEMNHASTNSHGSGHSTAADAANHELELNFLSEFLLHEDFGNDPASGHGNGAGLYGQDMKVEAMHVDLHNQGMYSTGRGAMAPLQHYSQYQPHQDHQAGNSPHSSSSSVADAAEPLDRKAKRRQQVAISARRHRSRKKHELLDLRKEVSFMSSQLDFLRSKHKMMRPNGAVAEWEEKAMAQRRKRRQAEGQNEELRRAIFMQSQFLGNLKSVFSSSPMFTEDLNMRQLLHTYTRLGRNPRSRQRDYEAICGQSKMQMATDILRRQTDSIRFSSPYIKTQIIDSGDVFGATIVSVYAFDSLDVVKMFRATTNAIKESSNAWPEFTDLDGQRRVVDVIAQSNIVYGKQTTRYKMESSGDADSSDAQPHDEVVVETRVISFWNVTEHEAVLVWDFVDDDDLHPPRDDYDVRRDMVGAVLVRRELCEDGKERVVCRSICSKLHTRPRNTDKADLIAKFSTSPSRSLTRMCGNVVFQSIQETAKQLTA